MPERDGLWIFTRLRDFIDSIANSSPARLALTAFGVVILIFTALLSLPLASATGQATPLYQALFTSVSAVCVTGLTVVSTAVHWSFFGQLVILVGIFVGGLGTLTLASLLALMVSKKLGVRGKLIAQEAMNAGRLGEVGTLLRIVIVTSVVIEAALALVLIPRFLLLGESFPQSVWHGVFYAISSFNNAGFTPHSDGIVPYETDLWILIPLMLGVFLGSLGFPVVMVLQQNGLRWKKWNLHTKLTIQVSVILLVAGTVLWGLLEWDNVRTIGTMDLGDKITHSLFASCLRHVALGRLQPGRPEPHGINHHAALRRPHVRRRWLGIDGRRHQGHHHRRDVPGDQCRGPRRRRREDLRPDHPGGHHARGHLRYRRRCDARVRLGPPVAAHQRSIPGPGPV
jgi:Trk-type K+ transport system membrane component